MPQLEIENKIIEYEVRVSQKASEPRIDSELQGLTVVIPSDSSYEPEELLRSNSKWVKEKYQEKNEFVDKIPERNFEEGETFPLKGNEYELVILDETRGFLQNKVVLGLDESDSSKIEQNLRKIYRKEAREIFEKKLDKYAPQEGLGYNKLQIRNQRTRWGSCSEKDNLSFNWRIVMAPEFVIEYITVHELVHLEIPNHSDDYWEKVAEIFPEYEKAEEWLKNNRHTLALTKSDIVSKRKSN